MSFADPSSSRRTLQVLMPYHYFTLGDWLVEPSPAETNALLAIADRDVAASDGRQLAVCPMVDISVPVHFEYHTSPPPLGNAGDGHQDLQIECPSGAIYISQPTALAIDLRDALPEGAGTYAVRVSWRGRTGDVPEEYLLQMWRTGPLSLATLEEFRDDED